MNTRVLLNLCERSVYNSMKPKQHIHSTCNVTRMTTLALH